jgi:hypothetical protein
MGNYRFIYVDCIISRGLGVYEAVFSDVVLILGAFWGGYTQNCNCIS